MRHIVSANNLSLRIGKQRKRIAELLRLPLVNIGRIDADTNNVNTACGEIGKPLLKTPQLGVAQRSPKAAVENQHDRLRSGRSAEQIAKPNGITILIQ